MKAFCPLCKKQVDVCEISGRSSVYCKECGVSFRPDFSEMSAWALGETKPAAKWTPAANPPEDHLLVLVVSNNPFLRYDLAYYEAEWKTWSTGGNAVFGVTYWMPLPEMPKKVKP